MRPRCMLGATLVVMTVPAAAQTRVTSASHPGWTSTDGGCSVWDDTPEAGETVSWDGGCQNGRASGFGVEIWRLGGKEVERYEGEMRHGKLNGHGSFTFEHGDRYDGGWVDGEQSGHGVVVWADGSRYDGGFVRDRRSGHGVYADANGERYDGEWADDMRSGHGVMVWANGDRYDGDWLDHKRSGHGVMVWANGSRYDGDWLRDRPSGHGAFEVNGARWDGEWIDGGPSGRHPEWVKPVDAEPDWHRKPSAEEFARFWPADSRGVSGWAVISCTVTSQGTLDDCKLVSEEPPGRGFGGAALLMAPMFIMRPATREGVAVGGARVNIPIRFENHGVANSIGPTVNVAQTLPWSETPTAAAMAAAFPRPNAGRVPYGHVVLRCQVTGKGTLDKCAAVSEDPPDGGFANAAVKLVKDFRIVSDWKAAKGPDNLWVDLPFDFRDPRRPGTPVEIVDPQWIKTSGLAGSVFPEQAAKAGFKTGVATLVCEAAHAGALINCQVASESPVGLGFGKAALAVAAVMVMNPWTPQGAPVDGAHVRLPIRVNIGDEPPAPQPVPPR